MSLVQFLKDRFIFLFINIFLFIIIASIMALVEVRLIIIFFMFFIWFMPLLSSIVMEFIRNKIYYNEVIDILKNLEKKYMLPDIIKEPEFMEGKIFYNIINEISKDMHENVKYYRDIQNDYREYIETWVHEIKTPVASSKLILENCETPINSKINSQLNRIEDFVEQVLYYSRSNNVSKDYIISKLKLDTAINNVLRRNSIDFINKKIKLEIKNIDKSVNSDIKWIEFIVNQIISNAIKYSKDEDPKIKIYTIEKDNCIIFTIEDNGIGISKKEIERVFEKSFTGENGRKFIKSTGMGLYLSKKLCKKLGLGINIESNINEGTKVNIIFPIGKLTQI
ncbi:ATP-binding protein [Clostridium gasigenes]|uniref:ATP-binding protein n=1 Tax=Clostridium gasigenes TaxID=94869 RepID=UPI001C0E239B|nr:sensor histidine kinase [Clostridium gasigenes]